MAETSLVHDPQLRDSEGHRHECVRHVGVGQFRAESLTSGSDDRRVVEGRGRKIIYGEPRGIARYRRIQIRRDQGDVGRRDDPSSRIPADVAAGLQLLEKTNIGEVHLRCEMAAERRTESLRTAERTTGQRPVLGEGFLRPLPQQGMKFPASNLKHHR